MPHDQNPILLTWEMFPDSYRLKVSICSNYAYDDKFNVVLLQFEVVSFLEDSILLCYTQNGKKDVSKESIVNITLC